MHAIRGRWVGQPFALAKSNESEGRKTRIRRSKEERKAMVEVFIKKYQESSNGSFPSLNLTHKEVGGSFYTVREIVRDIIQENRVLGPGKFLLEEQIINQSLEENPLESIAIEPQSSLTLSSKEADFPVNCSQVTNEETTLLSDGQCTSTNVQDAHSGPVINGSLVDMSNNNASDDPFKTDLQVNEHKEVEEDLLVNEHKEVEEDLRVNEHKEVEEDLRVNEHKEVEEDLRVNEHKEVEEDLLVNEHKEVEEDLHVNDHKLGEERIKEELGTPITHATPLTADVVVETFPLRPMSKAVNCSDENSETWISTGGLKEQVSQSIELESEVGLFDVDSNYCTKTSGLVDEKVTKNFASPLLEIKSDMVEESLAEVGGPIVESSNGSILKEGSKHEIQSPEFEVSADSPTSVTFEQRQKSNEVKAADATSGTQNLNETFNSGIDQASSIKKYTEVENKVDAQQNGAFEKESIPTLNRINLESWEGASKKSSKPEDNPLLAIFKSFVAAFVKFWSE